MSRQHIKTNLRLQTNCQRHITDINKEQPNSKGQNPVEQQTISSIVRGLVFHAYKKYSFRKILLKNDAINPEAHFSCFQTSMMALMFFSVNEKFN